MEKPIPARLSPYLVSLQAGRAYLWCRCGLSKKQPYCDGSHRGTGIEPMRFVASRTEEALLCGCKATVGEPFCDGTHNNLPGGAPLDDPQSPANRGFSVVNERGEGRTPLNGECYIAASGEVQQAQRGALRYGEIISSRLGAIHQSQFVLEIAGEPSAVMSFGDCDAILFVAAGEGSVSICGRALPVRATDGVYVRPGEAFQLVPAQGSTLRVYASASPARDITWLQQMPAGFDEQYPTRVASVDEAQRTEMGPRYFQCLVDKRIGSNVITQFIGHIPPSKATPHRHLYEESLIILSGAGWVWTDDRKAPITAGDVVFLPRKQLHSLEATSAEGMEVVGVICPGDNPSINYY